MFGGRESPAPTVGVAPGGNVAPSLPSLAAGGIGGGGDIGGGVIAVDGGIAPGLIAPDDPGFCIVGGIDGVLDDGEAPPMSLPMPSLSQLRSPMISIFPVTSLR